MIIPKASNSGKMRLNSWYMDSDYGKSFKEVILSLWTSNFGLVIDFGTFVTASQGSRPQGPRPR